MKNATIYIDKQRHLCQIFSASQLATAPSSILEIFHRGETIMQRKPSLAAPSLCLFFAVLLSISASAQSVALSAETGKPTRPNILFIIMDDVGIDQMQIFGYGGATPPLTPNINAIAREPACASATSGPCPSVLPVALFSLKDAIRSAQMSSVPSSGTT